MICGIVDTDYTIFWTIIEDETLEIESK